MLGTIRKVEITLEDAVVIESRLWSRRLPKGPTEVRRAGSAAVYEYLAFRMRQLVRAGAQFIVEHIEVAAH